jgi:tetratricopeptide (TPR) repeat protein
MWCRAFRAAIIFSAAISLCGCSNFERDFRGAEHGKEWKRLRENASVAFLCGKYAEAEKLYAQSAIEAANCVDVQNSLVVSLSGQAEAEEAQGNFVDAEKCVRKALVIQEGLRTQSTSSGKDTEVERQSRLRDCDYVRTRVLLANILRDQGKVVEAESLYLDSIKLSENALCPLAEINKMKQHYARLLRRAHKESLALRIEQEIALSSVDYSDWEHAQTTGQRLFTQNENEKAQGQFKTALAAAERIGKDDWRYGLTLSWIAIVEEAKNDLARAKDHQLQAMNIIEKSLGADEPRLVAPLSHLAQLASLAGDKEKARAYLDRAIAIMTAVHGAGDSTVRTLIQSRHSL